MSTKNTDDNCRAGNTRPTRRAAMGVMAAGGAAGALAVSGSVSGLPAGPAHRVMIAMSAEEWEQRIGERFALLDEQRNVQGEIRLEQVIEDRWTLGRETGRPATARPCGLTLLFSSPKTIDEKTWSVRHPRLGQSSLFLNRTVRHDFPDTMIYQTVIS